MIRVTVYEIFYLICFLIGLTGIGTVILVRNILRHYRSARWPTVKGNIIDLRIEKRERFLKTFYKPHVRYRYDLDGLTYEGSNIGLEERWFGKKERAISIAGRYQKGEEVDIHFDPLKPAAAILKSFVE